MMCRISTVKYICSECLSWNFFNTFLERTF